MTIKNTIAMLREFVAELLYIGVMPTLVLLIEHLRIIYFGQVMSYALLVAVMFSFAFPKASSFINLLLLSIVVDDSLHAQKKLFRWAT